MPGLEAALDAPATLDATAVVLLALTAVATSALSAMVGIAGGMILLTVLLLYVDPLVAIPLHAAVQMVSNGSRTWLHRRVIERAVVASYALLLLPAGVVGLAVASRLGPEALRGAIGVFVLVATWAPGLLRMPGSGSGERRALWRFVALGGVAGVLNVTIGATGPLTAPFFRGLGLDRFALIGTLAATQLLGHLAKVLVFGVVGFAFGDYAALLALLALLVMVGAWLGTRALERIDERRFTWFYRSVLTLLALRLVAQALMR